MAQMSPNKNIHTDFGEGWVQTRLVTAVDPAISLDPGALDNLSGVYRSDRAKAIQLRLFSDTSGATPTLILLAAPSDGPKRLVPEDPESALTKSKLSRLINGQFTTSGSITSGINPLTGESDPTRTWWEMSTTGAGINDRRVKLSPSALVTGIDMTFQIDCLGDSLFFVYITSLGGSTGILVGFKRIE